jgi:hypothetical protein
LCREFQEEKMKKYIALICCLLTGAAIAQSKSAVGTWKLDPSQSQNSSFKSANLVITKDDETQIAWRISGVGQDGNAIHESFSEKRETEGPVKGMEGEKATWHKDGSFDVTTADGKSIHMASSLSDDGTTMTVTGTSDGKDVKDVWVKSGKADKK